MRTIKAERLDLVEAEWRGTMGTNTVNRAVEVRREDDGSLYVRNEDGTELRFVQKRRRKETTP